MKRSQILLTNELTEEIARLATRRKVSKSEMVRVLLQQTLNLITENVQNQSENREYVYALDKYTGKDPRIVGFKELFSVGANITQVYVIDGEVFSYYKKNKTLPTNLEHNLLEIGRRIKEASLTKKLVLRRAFVVPGLENPPGPRFLGIQPEELVGSLKDLFEFAIKQNYDIKDGFEIAAFFYPFADPEPLKLPLKEIDIIPYGGYAYPLNKNNKRVEILSVWGNNEGVQSFDAIDRYIVDTSRMIIVEKDIPQKNLMLATTDGIQSNKINVPVDKQFEQVLNDQEILEVARVVAELGAKYEGRRVEFSFDGRDSLEFNESAPYSFKRVSNGEINQRGEVLVISSEDDLKQIVQTKDFSKDHVIYVDKSIIENRSYDLLNAIAGLNVKFTVLYPGLSATAHAMRVLADFGHTAIVVGNRVFNNRDIVHISTDKKGEVVILKENESLHTKYIRNLYDAKLYSTDIVGGKAMNLSLLKTRGFNVPHGVVLTTQFFEKVLTDSKLTFKSFLASSNELEIDAALWSEVLTSELIDKSKVYSVRSSATVEDHSEHSFAGQFDTYLNVEFKDLKESVLKVIKSASNQSVRTYFNALDIKTELKMAVVIQEMVDVDFAGVTFGKDIQTRNLDNIVIDMALGLGEGVVDGTAKSTRAIYSRTDGEIIQLPNLEVVPISRPILNALVEMALSIERLMGSTQDIEWAIDKKGVVWVLQSRDV